MTAFETPGDASRTQPRRRADAERSRAAVLDAALRLLAERPDAGMAAIATAAGVTRQTVYAHFGTRDALLDAVADRITDQAMAAMDEAEENGGPALDSLLRLQDIGWRLFEHNPVLLQLGSSRSRADGDADADQARHEPVTARLTRLIEEGQASGEFDPAPPATWLVAAVTALGHAAGAEVGAGRMPAEEAATWLRTATLALLGVGPRNSAL